MSTEGRQSQVGEQMNRLEDSMKTWIALLAAVIVWSILFIAALVVFAGCGGDNFQVSPVLESQLAPHAGYNIGPDSYVQPGDEVKVSGVVIWIEGLDPNDIVDQL